MAVRYAPTTKSASDDIPTDTRVTGGGGVQLHVLQGGNRAGRPIVFIHGFSQCWLSWSRQMHSDLANEFRLLRWTCAATASQTSHTMRTRIVCCGPTISLR